MTPFQRFVLLPLGLVVAVFGVLHAWTVWPQYADCRSTLGQVAQALGAAQDCSGVAHSFALGVGAGAAASAPAPPAAPGPTAAEVAAVVQGRAAPVAERLAAIRADIVWTQRSPERVTALLRGMIIDIRSRTDLRDGAWQYSLTRRGTGSPAASGILHGLAEAKEAALAALSLRPSQA